MGRLTKELRAAHDLALIHYHNFASRPSVSGSPAAAMAVEDMAEVVAEYKRRGLKLPSPGLGI